MSVNITGANSTSNATENYTSDIVAGAVINRGLISQGASIESATNEAFGSVASSIIDGNDSSQWHGAGSFPEIIVVNLGATRFINRIRTLFGNQGGQSTHTAVVEGWNGTAWVPLTSYAATANDLHTTDITGVSISKYRIRITADTYNYGRLFEVSAMTVEKAVWSIDSGLGSIDQNGVFTNPAFQNGAPDDGGGGGGQTTIRVAKASDPNDYVTKVISWSKPLDVTAISRPTTSINSGSTFAPTAVYSGGNTSLAPSFVWKVGADDGALSTIAGATTVNPTLPANAFVAGKNRIRVEVTRGAETDSIETTVWAGTVTGALSTENATEDYVHNIPNVANGSISILSGGGSVVVVNPTTVRFTKPVNGNGTTSYKIADSLDPNNYVTNSVNWTYDASPPSKVTGLNGTPMSGKNRLTFNAASDAQSNISGYKWQRDTVNSFNSGNLFTDIQNNNSTTIDDSSRAHGGGFWYRVMSINGAGIEALEWSDPVFVQSWQSPPVIAEASPITTAELGQFFAEAIAVSGGDGNVTLVVEPGYPLPAGMNLVGYNYQGTRSALGTVNFRLRATDEKNQTVTKDFAHAATDTTVPSQVLNFTAVKVNNGQIDTDSDVPEDYAGISGYFTQIATDAGFSVGLQTYFHVSKIFSIIENLSPALETLFYLRRRGRDTNTLVGAYSDVKTVRIVPQLVAQFTIAASFAVGQSVTATKTSTGGSLAAHTYKWRWKNSPTILSTAPNQNLGALSAGNYELELEETDAYGTVATASRTFVVIADTTPEIYTEALLPWARIGHAYSTKLEAFGGEGNKIWDIPAPVEGVSIDSNGNVTVANPTGVSIVFTARVRDENGAGEAATRQFTIPVSPLAVWQWGYDLPLDRTTGKKVRVFIPRSGAADRQTRTDRQKKRKLDIKSSYYSDAEWNAIEDFHDEHYPSVNFLIYDFRRKEYFTAWFPSDINSREGNGQGEFSVIVEEV